MKTFPIALLLALLSFFPFTASADPGGSCHFHGSKPATEATVLKCADQRKATLTSGGRLEKSWGTVKHDSIAMVDGKKGKEWRVIYKNPAVNDDAKKTLYMFFTAPGNFIAANFTGQ
jgi:hypothetical protein